MHPRDHLSYSGGRAGPPTWKRARGAMENAALCWSQRHERHTSSAVSPVVHLPRHTAGLLALSWAGVGTAWLLRPAGLGSHVGTQTQLPYVSWESPPF